MRRRLRDAADARLEIEEALLAASADGADPNPPTRARWTWAAAGMVAGALLAGAVVWGLRPAPAARVSAHLAIPLPASGALEAVNGATMVALSRDGSGSRSSRPAS
jgi:hypothetical protein